MNDFCYYGSPCDHRGANAMLNESSVVLATDTVHVGSWNDQVLIFL